MANGDTVERWTKVVTQLGLPTVLAGILLWVLISRLLVVFDAMKHDLQEQTHAIKTIERILQEKGKQ